MVRIALDYDEKLVRKAYKQLVADPVRWSITGLTPGTRRKREWQTKRGEYPPVPVMLKHLCACGWTMGGLLRRDAIELPLPEAFAAALAEEDSWKALDYSRQTVANKRLALGRGAYPSEKLMRRALLKQGWKCAVQEKWIRPVKAKGSSKP